MLQLLINQVLLTVSQSTIVLFFVFATTDNIFEIYNSFRCQLYCCYIACVSHIVILFIYLDVPVMCLKKVPVQVKQAFLSSMLMLSET